jgi:hypothetical protein
LYSTSNEREKETDTEFWKANLLESSFLGRIRWEDNIKRDLREIGYEDGRWMELVQDQVRWWWTSAMEVLKLHIILPEI